MFHFDIIDRNFWQLFPVLVPFQKGCISLYLSLELILHSISVVSVVGLNIVFVLNEVIVNIFLSEIKLIVGVVLLWRC